MLKVLIADDEERVCRLVQLLADWEALGMEVAATAGNGLEALEKIESVKPDILVTDIRMPGCDGLELIERAKKASPNLEIALISGYAQFEYAQIAMRYDVGGYLLKPIKKDTLMDILEKLGKRCRERAAAAEAMDSLRQDSHKNSHLLRGRLIEDMLGGGICEPSADTLRGEYGLDVQDGLLQAFILKTDFVSESPHGAGMRVIKEKAAEVFEGSVLPLCFAGVLHFRGSFGYGAVNYAPESREAIRRALRQLLNQMEAQRPIFGAAEFSLAIGGAGGAENLPVSLDEARRAICERLTDGTGRMFELAPRPPAPNLRRLLDSYSLRIERAADTLDTREADGAADALRAEAGNTPGLSGHELLDIVLTAGKMFAMRISAEDEAELSRKFEARCELCGSSARLFDCLRSFTHQQTELTRARRENEAIRPIRIAKQYIHQHYSEPITLEAVCEATGFSVSYFSAMFKKETGEGFSKYLTRVRIEQAKAMLRDTSFSVSDICGKVGYSDLKHFTGTFKKLTSLNPGQYRKLYG